MAGVGPVAAAVVLDGCFAPGLAAGLAADATATASASATGVGRDGLCGELVAAVGAGGGPGDGGPDNGSSPSTWGLPNGEPLLLLLLMRMPEPDPKGVPPAEPAPVRSLHSSLVRNGERSSDLLPRLRPSFPATPARFVRPTRTQQKYRHGTAGSQAPGDVVLLGSR